ncbi:MAG TPA: tetratricopeptide repeat protein [Tepidisphaeraceae bacterium]|nr:tetratricopeptide repeat protein [Tepidisphaeraceae bacterium]
MNRRFSLLLGLLVFTGCVSRPTTGARPAAIPSNNPLATTQPGGRDSLSLDQIQPAPVLKPVTGELSDPPPIEAVRLFARSRSAVLDNDATAATDLLEKAVALDPDSFELHKQLGDLYQATGNPAAAAEWEKAASIDPDRLDLQVNLGRHYAARAQFDKAIAHLRLALQTSDYRHDDPMAAEADFLLGRALQESGYDRAALATYERLLNRLQTQPWLVRQNPQGAGLLSHPEALALHVAALYEKHQQYAEAQRLLRSAAQSSPNEFEVQAQLVRVTAAAGQPDKAAQMAVDLVLQFQASPASLGLLREASGSDQAAIATLADLHRRNPEERPLLYALIDTEFAHGQANEAERLLEGALARWPDDLRLLRRRVSVLRDRGAFKEAAEMLIAALSRRPDNYPEIASIWDSLPRPSPRGRLRISDVQALSVSESQTPARLLLLGRSFRIDRGPSAQRDPVRKATDARPIFAPAWREMLSLIWSDESQNVQQKADASVSLAGAAAKAGDLPLADELRGVAAMNQDQPQAAALAFARAVRQGDRSPELVLNFATALHLLHDDAGAQSLLVKLLSNHPLYDDAYLTLYEIAQGQEENPQGTRVIRVWLAADPDNTTAQRMLAKEALDQRRYSDAQRSYDALLASHPADPEALAAVEQFYSRTSRLDEFTERLSGRLSTEPWNLALGEALAQAFQEQHKTTQAVRVADELRSHVGDDADLLYRLSGLYSRLGADTQSEQILAQVLKLDPSYAGANNDLGFLWADHGRNLGQAEELVRRAVAAEPDNTAFLDSLGWVLYKRGKFAEALPPLTRAASPTDQADPVVLDHLGDTQYRLGDRGQAARTWQLAAKRLTDMRDDTRDDLKELRTQLLQKQQDLSAGRAVNVSPVAK